MSDFISRLIHKKYIVKGNKKITISVLDIVALVIISVIGLLVRNCFLSYESNDYLGFLTNWVEHFRINGFRGIADGLYDYTPTYMYALYIVSIVPIKRIVGIKFISIVFDYVLAVAVGFMAAQSDKKDGNWNVPKGIMAYGVILFTPTVVSNSAMWGQCDVIYVTFIVWALYLFMRDKPGLGMLFYGIAFALKLQSIFLFPVLVLLWICKKIKTNMFLSIPFVYLISIVPAWMAGRKLIDLLLIYVKQAKGNSVLTLKWPNIYYLLGIDMFVDLYGKAAIWFTVGLLLLIFYYLVKKCLVIGIDERLLITISLLCVMIITYFLPFMHERYGYLADILCVIFAFYYTNKFYIPILHISISFLAYTKYYTKGLQEEAVPMVLLSVVLFMVIWDVAHTLHKSIKELEDNKKNEIQIKKARS